MFLLVSHQRIHIVSGKAAKQAHQGFSCVSLSDMGITPITWAPYSITLGTGPVSMAQNHNDNGLLTLTSASIFTGDSIAGTGWVYAVAWRMSMGDGGGVGVVFSFNCLRSWGKSPGIDSSTASLIILHPSATVLCPSVIILWPDATFLMATTILTQNTFSLTCSTFIWLSKTTGTVLYCTKIIDSFDMIDIPINIFLLVSFPFW